MKSVFVILIFLTSVLAKASTLDEINKVRVQFHQPTLAGASLVGGTYLEFVTGVRKYGDPTPSKQGDLFHLGSNTKSMTSVLIANLISKGKLSWTTKLKDIFPELFKEANPVWYSLTIEQLLSHTSGISNQSSDFVTPDLWADISEPSLKPKEGRYYVVSEVMRSPALSTPGTQFNYSNFNYIILGAVIDRITGSSWEADIRSSLFIPLKMTSCRFGSPGFMGAPVPDQPWQHRLDNGVTTPIAPGIQADNPVTLNSAGRVSCSLKDWSRFIQFLMDGYNNKPTPLLDPQIFQKLLSPSPINDYTYAGMFRTERDWSKGPVFTHAGSNTMSVSVVWWAPAENQAYMSATNQGDGNDSTLAFSSIDSTLGILMNNNK